LEILPLVDFGSGYGLVREYLHEFPVIPFLDFFLVISDLRFIARNLLLGIRGDAAIGRHPEFLARLVGVPVHPNGFRFYVCDCSEHFRKPPLCMHVEFRQQSLFDPDELIDFDSLSLVKDVKPMELRGVIEHVLCLSFNLANS